MLSRALVLKTASWKPVERLVRHSRLFKRVVSRFIAGDTLDEAVANSEALAKRGFFISLDYLGEGVSTPEAAEQAKATYVRMFDRLAESPCFRSPHPPLEGFNVNPQPFDFGGKKLPVETANVSIKLTQCGMAFDEALAERNFRDVARVAQGYGSFLRIDMEDSPYTDTTLQMVELVHTNIPSTGTVVQAYLRRTAKDVERLIDQRIRVRLVKGAYLEPADIAFQSAKEVDEEMVGLGKRLLDAGNYPAFATHNERILRTLVAYAGERGIAKDRFEMQMLYGIRRDLQDSLLAEGYNVRVYLPFGESWYPYFSRRLAERPANLMFILRAMLRS